MEIPLQDFTCENHTLSDLQAKMRSVQSEAIDAGVEGKFIRAKVFHGLHSKIQIGTDNYFAYSSSFLIPHSHDSAYESKKLIVVVFFFDLVDEGMKENLLQQQMKYLRFTER